MPTCAPRSASAMASGSPTWPQPPTTTTSRSNTLPGDHSVTGLPSGHIGCGSVDKHAIGLVVEPEAGPGQIAAYGGGLAPDKHPADVQAAGVQAGGAEQGRAAGVLRVLEFQQAQVERILPDRGQRRGRYAGQIGDRAWMAVGGRQHLVFGVEGRSLAGQGDPAPD